jgi:hypothetical protein
LSGLLRKDPAARLSPAQARDLLTAEAGPGERPSTQDRPPGPGPATRIDPPPWSTDGGAPGGRDHPVAVRGALACAWLAVAGILLLPYRFGHSLGLPVLLETAPRWLVGALVLVVVFSIGLWNLTHRPVLALATVAVINLLLALAAPMDATVALVSLLDEQGRVADVGDGLALGWLAGAVALMFAFEGANKPLIARMPSPRSREALLTIAVIVEGVVAVMWPVVVFGALGVRTDLNPIDEEIGGERILMASLGLVLLAWIAAQVVTRSGRGRAGLRR